MSVIKYIGARYIPIPYEGPGGSAEWIQGAAYDGLIIVTYGGRSYISKKPVPAQRNLTPNEDAEYWVPAALYNADVEEAMSRIEDLEETKADKDGFYPDLWAGHLISDIRMHDNTPYLFRKTGGTLSGVGERCYETIIGASVGENQLVNKANFPATQTVDGLTLTNNDDGSLTINGTATAFKTWQLIAGGFVPVVEHKYLGYGCPPGGSYTTYALVTSGSVDSGKGFIHSYSSTSTQYLWISISNGTTANNLVFRPQFIDLTQMLGSTIADYLYNLETATAGSGIAKLREWGFLKGYQAYNAGSIESVEVTGKKVVGFNQWDEEWESGGISDSTGQNADGSYRIRSKNYIPVIPGGSYYYRESAGYYIYMRYYDANKNFVKASSGHITNTIDVIPDNVHFVRFMVYKNEWTDYENHGDICINLSNPDRNGEYEPYTAQEYDYGDDTLNGIFKLDSNNNLYADGDTKTSDGTVTRKYGVVDLGTLDWEYDATYNRFYSRSFNDAKAPADNNTVANIICAKYMTVTDNQTSGVTYNESIGISLAKRIDIRDESYTDATAFKNSLSNVMLVYELATPTTEQSTPFTSPQVCYPDGTEEYITENGVPVGHETEYLYNIDSVIDSILQVPAESGTYTLRAVRTAAGITYEWVTT